MKRIFLIFAAMVVIFGCAVLAINPAFADIIYDEDNLFENLTVAACGIALALSLILFFIRLKKKAGYGFWLFISFLLFMFIGDEISWGMKYFGFTKHKIAGVGFDGLHDALSISVGMVKLVRNYIRSIGFFDIKAILIYIGSAAAISALAYLLIKLFINKKERIFGFFSKNLTWEPFLFLFIGIILLVAAMVIDDDNLVGFPHKSAVEESMEFLAAASFLFSCLTGIKFKKPETRVQKPEYRNQSTEARKS